MIRLRLALTIALLTVGLVGLPSAPSQATDYHPEWGSATSPNGELLRGCHSYPLDYALTPPPGQWALEVFITGPRGESVASLALLEGANALAGTSSFMLCVPTTPSGTFTINAKLTVNGEGTAGRTEGFLPPDTFTLTKAKRSHGKLLTLGPVHIVRGGQGHRHSR